MSFEIGRGINDASDRILKTPIVRTVADNPVYSAVAIALLVMVCLMLIYSDNKTMTIIRGGFWAFVASLLVIFLRDRSEANRADEQLVNSANDIFVTPMIFTEDHVPVAPQTQMVAPTQTVTSTQ